MHSDSLTLPFPNPSLPIQSWFRQPWRWLSFPDTITAFRTASAQSPSDDRFTRRFEKNLSRNARRQQRIVLGTPHVPYEPLALGEAPLAALLRFKGLAITVTTRSSEILEQLDLLAELDCRHAVAVDVLIASFEPGSVDLGERLRTVSALSAQGITTRLLLTDADSPLSSGTRADLRNLFEVASDHRAFDVGVAFGADADTAEWAHLVRCLRLEFGFPRTLAGRG